MPRHIGANQRRIWILTGSFKTREMLRLFSCKGGFIHKNISNNFYQD